MIITKTITLYTFDALPTSKAKEAARNWWREGNFEVETDAIKSICDDAERVGIRIITLDQHKANRGEFISPASEVAETILREHGKDCETYKTAEAFRKVKADIDERTEVNGDVAQWEEDREEAEKEFLASLLEDYRIMLEK